MDGWKITRLWVLFDEFLIEQCTSLSIKKQLYKINIHKTCEYTDTSWKAKIRTMHTVTNNLIGSSGNLNQFSVPVKWLSSLFSYKWDIVCSQSPCNSQKTTGIVLIGLDVFLIISNFLRKVFVICLNMNGKSA